MSEANQIGHPDRAGSRFRRADLHVHTHKDGDASPSPDLGAYLRAAEDAGIDVLAVTDHNHVRFARAALEAAESSPVTVLPGIEISTHDGHLLALFSPDAIEAL